MQLASTIIANWKITCKEKIVASGESRPGRDVHPAAGLPCPVASLGIGSTDSPRFKARRLGHPAYEEFAP